MKLFKRPSLLIVCTILTASCMMFFAQPFINSSAATAMADNEVLYNQNKENSNFAFDNAYQFQNESADWIYPVYINYLQSIDNRNDYDVLLSNGDAVSLEEKEQLHYLIQNLKQDFTRSYGKIHYYVSDDAQTNVYTNQESLSKQFTTKATTQSNDVWQIILRFNQDGILTVQDYSTKTTANTINITDSQMAEMIRRNKDQILHDLTSNFPDAKSTFVDIKNITFIFEITNTMGLGVQTQVSYGTSSETYYLNDAYASLFALMNGMILAAGILMIVKLPDIKQCRAYRFAFQFPVELIFLGWFTTMIICFTMDYAHVFGSASGLLTGLINTVFYLVAMTVNFAGLLWIVFFIEKMIKNGFRTTYKAHSFFYSGGVYVKKKTKEYITLLTSFNSINMSKQQLRIMIASHTLILCMLWYLHIFFMALYGLVLYLLWMRNNHHQQKDYQQLKDTIHRFSVGEFDQPVLEELGVFTDMKDDLISLQAGIREAIAQEVASQRMKNELITNVSHDLKTPLTAIISYIDLMKDEKLTNAEREKYVHTLEKSADRLKHLIEDLFEISKANSGNLNVELMEADLVSLLKQVEMECNNAFQKKHLIMKHSFSDEKILVTLDPQKAYRIFENLLSNVGKYALEKTRVFLQVTDYDTRVDVEIKNVSKAELDFSPEEIMERFTRGDKSRNTEGSGLGLAIAKSFTELMQGTMRIELDGDIFKVTISFYK